MMNKHILGLLFGGLLNACVPAMADSAYVIFRHGEKPAAGLGQLSCQGLNRALALPQVILSKYGQPAALFAPNPAVKKKDKGEPYYYIRPLATIEPLAIQTGLPVDIQWDMTQVKQLAASLLQQPDGVYAIAWEHHLAVQLAQALLQQAGGEAAQVPTWDDADFDSIYVVRRVANGSKVKVSFELDRQGLNAQPITCPLPNAQTNNAQTNNAQTR